MFGLRHLRPKSMLSTMTTVNKNVSFMHQEKNKYCHGQLVETEKVGHVFMIGINRPAQRNCVNHDTAIELISAFQQFEDEDGLWTAVFYGKGGTFCAGYDLKSLAKMGEGSSSELPHPPRDRIDEKLFRPMGPSMMPFSKPVIAAIGGYAVAGGLELALMCDLRVVEESAIMGVFCRRFGVPLLDGGTVRLPALIGLSRAMDLILSGRPVAAAEAQEMGLANRVVPNGTAVGEAIKLAQSLCQFPQMCMRADRRSAMNSAYDAQSYEDAFKFEWEHGRKVLGESVKGAQKFATGEGRHGKFMNPSKL